MGKKQDKVTGNIKSKLNKYTKLFNIAIEKNLNEADTRNIIDDFLKDVLGYEMFDISSEYRIKGQYADYCLKIDNKACVLVEVKSINSNLKESHLFQVTSYAANEGIEWVILTNGNTWELYHLGSKMPIEKQLVVEVGVTDKEIKPKKKSELFYHFSKNSFASNDINEYWAKKTALSPGNITKTILGERVLNAIRLELKKQSGYNVDVSDLKEMISKNVIKKSLLG